ncbi:hypothetical protein LEP1GSC170_3492 [Leptospira interrogans serovar Bataviae str. HAI135]|nr:hypothetical protein LEP1GSC170_3492 [Leptospira interrogans serovar Bataviae str. HAI135]
MPLKEYIGRMSKIEKLLRISRIGMITNQSAFGPDGEYHFQSIHKRYNLKKSSFPNTDFLQNFRIRFPVPI